MDIKLDAAAMKAIMQEALMRQLKDIDREALIAAALAHIMTKDGSSHFDSRSPLSKAFECAAEQATRAVLVDEFAKPEVRARLLALVTAAMEKALSDHDGLVTRRMAEAFSAALSPR